MMMIAVIILSCVAGFLALPSSQIWRRFLVAAVAHFLPGVFRPPFPRSRMELEKNPQWLVDQLKANGTIAPHTQVTDVKLSAPPAEKGKAHHTFLVALTLLDDKAHQTVMRLVIKTNQLRVPIWMRWFASTVPARELTFSTKLAHVVQEKQAPDSLLLMAETVLGIDYRPQCHHFLVMKCLEGEVITDTQGADEALAIRHTRALADLHSTFWNDPKSIASRALSECGDHYSLVLMSIPKAAHPLWRAIKKTMDDQLPHTACQGDCRLGNTMWPKDSEKVAFIDWELAFWSDPLWDLIYFSWTSQGRFDEKDVVDGGLTESDWRMVDAWRARIEHNLGSSTEKTRLPKTRQAMADFFLIGQVRYSFWLSILGKFDVGDEWTDCNNKDRQIWGQRISKRSTSLYKRHKQIAAALDRLSPRTDGETWAPVLRALAVTSTPAGTIQD